MKAKKMIQHCDAVLQKLDDLEALLSYIPPKKEAHKFVYESIAAAKELRHVAKWETSNAVTVEQAAHIQRLISRTDIFLNMIPENAKKELGDDQEAE